MPGACSEFVGRARSGRLTTTRRRHRPLPSRPSRSETVWSGFCDSPLKTRIHELSGFIAFRAVTADVMMASTAGAGPSATVTASMRHAAALTGGTGLQQRCAVENIDRLQGASEHPFPEAALFHASD